MISLTIKKLLCKSLVDEDLIRLAYVIGSRKSVCSVGHAVIPMYNETLILEDAFVVIDQSAAKKSKKCTDYTMWL